MDKVPFPNKTIGCQQLINSSLTKHHGFLRWRSTLDQLLEKLPFINWSKAYVLVHDGSLYIFKTELSSKAIKCTSLVGFTKCENYQGGFRMMQCIGSENQVLCFSAASRSHMQKWIEVIEEEIEYANLRLLSSTVAKQRDSDNNSDHNNNFINHNSSHNNNAVNEAYIQANDYTPTPPPSSLPPSSSSPSSSPPSSSPPSSSPPSPPPSRPARKPKPSAPQRLQPPKGKKKDTKAHSETHTGTSTLAYAEFEDFPISYNYIPNFNENPNNFFWRGDPVEAERLMKRLSCAGAYMVRKSSDESGLTLLVRANKVVIKFKLTTHGSNLSMEDEDKEFPTLEHLITHFKINPLPGTTIPLTVPYLLVPSQK